MHSNSEVDEQSVILIDDEAVKDARPSLDLDFLAAEVPASGRDEDCSNCHDSSRDSDSHHTVSSGDSRPAHFHHRPLQPREYLDTLTSDEDEATADDQRAEQWSARLRPAFLSSIATTQTQRRGGRI